MIRIWRVKASTAFSVGVVVYGLQAAIFGLLFLVFPGVFDSFISNYATTSVLTRGELAGSTSLVTRCIFYVLLVVIGAISGGIQLGLFALFYNVACDRGWISGFQINAVDGNGIEIKSTLPSVNS